MAQHIFPAAAGDIQEQLHNQASHSFLNGASHAPPPAPSPTPAMSAQLSALIAQAQLAQAAVKTHYDSGGSASAAQPLLQSSSQANTALLRSQSYDVAHTTHLLGGEYLGPHIDAERISQFFDGIASVDDILPTAQQGLIPPVTPFGPVDNATRLASNRQGNLASVDLFPQAIHDRILLDAALGRILLSTSIAMQR